jgi:hypothetical protein
MQVINGLADASRRVRGLGKPDRTATTGGDRLVVVTGSPLASPCPRCGQHAPIVLRGLDSRCAACGAPRFLLAAPSVALAGRPSKLGGAAASLAGVSVLVLGLSLAVGLFFLLSAFLPVAVGWAFAVPTAAASLLFGILLLLGGSRLKKSGAARQQRVALEAVRSVVQHRRGPISAAEVASSLQLPEPDVDALLTQLAREKATAVTVDVDQQGHVVYDFEGEERRWRVLEEQESPQEPGWQEEERTKGRRS